MLNTQSVAALLNAIIPSGGRYVGFAKSPDKGGGRNLNALDLEELVGRLFKENEKGREVYFAPASYDGGDTRKAVAAVGLRAFFFDLDAHGDGKGYDTVEEAKDAAVQACEQLGLPRPVIVDTGGGAQAFILVKAPVPAADWTRIARSLKAALTHIGVKQDPTRTADAASIMRLPGSFNHKRGRASSIDMERSGWKRSELDVIEKALAKYGSSVKLATSNGKPTRLKPARYARHNKDASLIVSRCAQLAFFKETGSETEPHWFGACSVLATCMDGEALFHEWSSVYPRYKPEEAQAKFAAALETDAPHTCAKFNDCNDLCEGCPYFGKITSPAELGVLRTEDLPSPPPVVTADGETMDYEKVKAALPEGYAILNDQLVFQTCDKDGNPVNEKVCDRPVWFEGRARQEGGNNNFITMRHYSKIDNELMADVFPISELMGRNGMAVLQNVGPVVRNDALMFNFVQESREKLNRETAMSELYGSFGWKKEGFLLGPLLYQFAKGGEPKLAALLPGSFAANCAGQLTPGGGQRLGSLEGWKDAVRFCTQPGFEFQLDALITSFASPLLFFVAKEEGGELRNYCSRDTGRGKSAASQLGQSVWGGGKALQIAAGTSEITRANIWEGAGHLPTFEDEANRLDAVQVKNRLMAFTTGKTKSVSGRDSRIKANRSSRTSFYIATSNESILAALSQGEGSDAMAARVFETQVPPLPCRSDPKLLTKLAANPGWAGPEFIRLVVRNAERIAEVLNDQVDKYSAKFPAVRYRYKVQGMACAAVALELLIKFGLLEEFDTKRYLDWRCAEMKDDQQYTETANKEDVLRMFFDEARDKTLTVEHGTLNGRMSVSIVPGTNVPRSEIHVRVEVKNERCLISRRSLNSFLSRFSIPPREFYQWAKKEGFMTETDTSRDLTNGIATLTKGVEHVCIVNLKKWTSDDV